MPTSPNSLFGPSSASSLLELFTAHWKSAILASAVELGVFEHLERGSSTLAELSATTGLPPRSLQALMDGLVSLELVKSLGGDRFQNSEAVAAHLIVGKPGYLGGFARIVTGPGDGGMRQWSRLAVALQMGRPIEPETILEPDSPFWPELVMALLPLSYEVAAIAADLVGVGKGRPLSVLDVGGGAGAYALAWLGLNPHVRVTQIDWGPVNALARQNLDACRLGDRFTTVDGDFHSVPFGRSRHDLVVVSNICHHERPEAIVELLRRIAVALVPGGQVVLSDFVLRDDRTGPAFAACFGAGMILQTSTGASYRESDYHEWLESAGFRSATVDRSHPLSALLIAKT